MTDSEQSALNGEGVPAHPRLMVIASAILFSVAAPVTKYVDFGAVNVMFFRSLVGIGALIGLSPGTPRRDLWRFTPREALGGLAYACASICFFLALQNTTAANATILFQTTPVFLIPFGWLFLREKAGVRDVIAIILMLSGIAACLGGGFDLHGRPGDLIALAGAVSFGFLTIIIKRNRDGSSTRMLIAGNILIVLAALAFRRPPPFRTLDVVLASLLGVVHMAIPMSLVARALRYLEALEVSIIKNMETVLSLTWVGLAVGELPGLWNITGFVLVGTAILVRSGLKMSRPGRHIGRTL